MKALSLLALTLTLVVAAPRRALAQPSRDTAASDTLIARRLFREASELSEKGDWPGAVAKLREVTEIKDTAGVRVHLAHALAQTNHFVEAIGSLDRADELNASGPLDPEIDKAIAQERGDIEPHVAKLAIRCAEPCKVEALIVDGSPIAQPSATTYLDPGTHHVEVVASGYAPYTTDIAAKEGDRIELTPKWADPAPAPRSPAPTREPTAAPESTGSNAKTYVIVGEGAFAVTGIVLGLVFRGAANSAENMAIQQRGTLTSNCGNPIPSEAQLCADLHSNNDARNKNDTLATVSFVSAAAGIGAIIATELLWPKSEAHTASSAARFVAGASPSGIQLGVRGVLE